MIEIKNPYDKSGSGMEVTWDMRMPWYERLNELINLMTASALEKNVPRYLDFMQQLYVHTFKEIDEVLNKKGEKDFEEELDNIREMITDVKLFAKTKTALMKKKKVYNSAYFELIKLQKRILGAMTDKKMFMSKRKVYQPDEAILDLE